MLISVLSWNIWGGRHLDEVIETLRNESVDVIGLQEVIEKDGENNARKVANELGFDYVFYKALDRTRDDSVMGNAILSKFPIIESKFHQLSSPDKYIGTAETEPRIAVEARIKIGELILTIITTHLAYSHKFENSGFRDEQVNKLIQILPKEKVVLMGDFNSHPDSSYMHKFNEVLVNADIDLTSPTWTMYPFEKDGFIEDQLRHRLDYIFVSKDIKILDFSIPSSKGSDHLPVVSRLQLSS